MIRHLVLGSLVTTLVWFSCIGDLSAQGSRDHRVQGVRFDVHGDLAYYGGIGAGFRVDIPIVPHGFLHSSRVLDELVISAGLDVFFYAFSRNCYVDRDGITRCPDRGGFGLWPVVMAQWNLYLTRSWSVFPELGVAFVINDHNYRGFGDRRSDFYAVPAASIGARWHFSHRNSLLMRMNYPAGLQIGVTF